MTLSIEERFGTLAVNGVLGPDGRVVAEKPVDTVLDLSFFRGCLLRGTLDGWVVPTSLTTGNGELVLSNITTEDFGWEGCPPGFTPVSDDCSLTFYVEGVRMAEGGTGP